MEFKLIIQYMHMHSDNIICLKGNNKLHPIRRRFCGLLQYGGKWVHAHGISRDKIGLSQIFMPSFLLILLEEMEEKFDVILHSGTF
jgi:hypothetical protein